MATLHTGLTPTRKSYRDRCWQFGYQALTGLNWLKNVKVMGEREMKRKKIKVKAPETAKKNKQHLTSNCGISVTSATAELKFLLCVDLVQISH